MPTQPAPVRKPDAKLHHEIQCSFTPVSEVRCRELLTVGLRGGIRIVDRRRGTGGYPERQGQGIQERTESVCTHVGTLPMDPWTWEALMCVGRTHACSTSHGPLDLDGSMRVDLSGPLGMRGGCGGGRGGGS